MRSFSFARALRTFSALAPRWLFKLAQLCLVAALAVPTVALLLSACWKVPWAKIQASSSILGAIVVVAFASGLMVSILRR